MLGVFEAVNSLSELAIGPIRLYDSNGEFVGAIIQEGALKFFALPGDESLMTPDPPECTCAMTESSMWACPAHGVSAPEERPVSTATSIEHVARAILHAEHPEASGWSGKPTETKEHYRRLAGAALGAMGEQG